MSGFQGLGPIGQIALTVGDVEAATAFYADKLGMRHLFSAPPKMSFFECGGIRLMLGEPEGEEERPRSGSILYFQVPDIRAAHETLEERGVEFVEAPRKVAELEGTELWLAFLRDPWENTLALMSEVAIER